MDSEFTQQLIQLDNHHLVMRAMVERRDRILKGIEEKKIISTPAVMRELAELNVAIGDYSMDGGS